MGAIARITMSMLPPAGKETRKVIGTLDSPCPKPLPPSANRPGRAGANKTARRAIIVCFLARRLEIERLGDGGDVGALARHDLAELLGAAAGRGLCSGVELGVDLLV